MEMLDSSAVPYRVVLTKADKKGSGTDKAKAEVELELKKFAAAYPHAHLTSAEKGHGIPELRAAAASYSNM